MMKVLVINGPNLNLLGTREPQVYGSQTLEMINESLRQLAAQHSIELFFLQSNAEHELIDRVHLAAQQDIDYMIVNPAAFTHTSVALRDAIAAVEIPFIEVHLSNVHAREEFRSHSWFSDIAIGTVTGLGSEGYLAALRYIAQFNHPKTN